MRQPLADRLTILLILLPSVLDPVLEPTFEAFHAVRA